MMKLQEKALAYAKRFNEKDEETAAGFIPNKEVEAWILENIPFFECPDPEIEEIYYFRWWTYRKHIKKTPEGFIIDEFLPDVPWSGIYNSIVCPAGHHFYEGRWLVHAEDYLDSYARFWFTAGNPRLYSVWLCDAIYHYCELRGDFTLALELLPKMVENFHAWEDSNRTPTGLFWSEDDRDGGEISISGSGFRPTLNSYMCADAYAISKLAEMAGDTALSEEFLKTAEELRSLIRTYLWDGDFFKVIPCSYEEAMEITSLEKLPSRSAENDVRELFGFVPFYFDLATEEQGTAWRYFKDSRYFKAPFGYTSAEICHPRFMFEHPHECLWNGPVWPFNESLALKGAAKAVRKGGGPLGKEDVYEAVKTYAHAQHRTLEDGTVVPWIDEDQHPFTGEWIARSILKGRDWEPGGYERGKDYNHSTYNDIVLSDLLGIMADEQGNIQASPLVPDSWDYFRVEKVPVGGRLYNVAFDRNGERYGAGKGLRIEEVK